MKIGRNDPCPCGSGLKYKKCCLCNEDKGRPVQMVGGYIDMEGIIPTVRGFEEMPDLKWFLNTHLQRAAFSESFDATNFMNRAMKEYNKMIEGVNSRLPREYGVMLNEMKHFLEEKEYDKAIGRAESILEVFPESVEARMHKDEALLSQGLHEYSSVFSDLLPLKGKAKEAFLSRFGESFRNSSPTAKRHIFDVIEREMKNQAWQSRYAAVDLLKQTLFLNFDNEAAFDGLLIDALLDDKDEVRNNAFYCVSKRKSNPTSMDFFFGLHEAAEIEVDLSKKRNLCRSMLELVSPMLDEWMVSDGMYKEYRHAIDFALRVTGYDPTYYRADFRKKMMFRFTNRGKSRRGKK